MSLNIQIKYEKENDLLVVMPEGDIDIYTSNKFKSEVVNSFEKNQADISIDGSKLEYLDSTGLGALISILKTVQGIDKKITIINLKSNIKKLFDITELDKLFIIRGEGDD